MWNINLRGKKYIWTLKLGIAVQKTNIKTKQKSEKRNSNNQKEPSKINEKLANLGQYYR